MPRDDIYSREESETLSSHSVENPDLTSPQFEDPDWFRYVAKCAVDAAGACGEGISHADILLILEVYGWSHDQAMTLLPAEVFQEFVRALPSSSAALPSLSLSNIDALVDKLHQRMVSVKDQGQDMSRWLGLHDLPSFPSPGDSNVESSTRVPSATCCLSIPSSRPSTTSFAWSEQSDATSIAPSDPYSDKSQI